MDTPTTSDDDGRRNSARLSPSFELTITVSRGCVVLAGASVDVEPEASESCDMLLLPFLNGEGGTRMKNSQPFAVEIERCPDEIGGVLEPIMAAIREREEAAPPSRRVNQIEELFAKISGRGGVG